MIACFITTFFLMLLTLLGYKFAHYTDDTCLVIKDKLRWLSDRKFIAQFLEYDSHLKQHPDKIYLQHYSKGVEFLGMKIRFDRVLPSDRIVHNLLWKIQVHINGARNSNRFLYRNAIHFVQIINSYMGLFKWCNSYKLRKQICEIIISSKWRKVLYVAPDYSKVVITPEMKPEAIYKRLNKSRKKTRKVMMDSFYAELEAA